MILVIGGTGTTGRFVREHLAKADAPAVAASRGGSGGHGVRLDWTDAASWDGALADVDRMYVIAPAGESEPASAMRPFLDLALAKGVKRAVLLSSSVIERDDPGLGHVHQAIAESFPEWAVLRPSWFMQNFSGRHLHANAIRERGVITSATGGGRVGFIDARDIGRVAAHLLLADTALNSDAIITGPDALSYDDVAAVISGKSGRPVRHVEVDEHRMREIHSADGLPDEYAAMLARLDRLIAAGAEDRVTDGVLRLTGVQPRSFEEFAAETRWAA